MGRPPMASGGGRARVYGCGDGGDVNGGDGGGDGGRNSMVAAAVSETSAVVAMAPS